ncbi:MAG: GNAT family N-acetyltransferase [Solirubrobacteraceae bacterium]
MSKATGVGGQPPAAAMKPTGLREPEPLIRDVLLRDGSTLRLQTPTPVDFNDLKEFFDGLSPDSRYLRFHGYARTDFAARAAAEADGRDRFALIARHDARVVAVAGFDGLREPCTAEVAFAVADDFQHRGTGTRMLEQLAEIAAERAITRFDAEVMFDNLAMLGVFESVGFGVRRRGSSGELTVSLDITPTKSVRERIDERDHVAAVAGLRAILAPSSVAVVGAAATRGNVGHAVLANIVASGFEGVVMPVNRAGGVVCSMLASPSLAGLGLAAELVVIAAAGDELLEFAAEAASAGARALLLLPGGPEDDGSLSSEREERLLETVRGAGVRVVGPSSLGVINTSAEVSLNATFTGASVHAGGLAIISTSGALGIGLLGHAEARRVGVSIFASLGSRADVSTNDLLEWCGEDDRTAVVMLYVETFGNPERFIQIARRVSRKKPILAVKGRRSAARVRGDARSHTVAALHGDAIVDALLYQAGVLRFRSGEELFDAARLFESQPLPRGREIGIVSNSVGMATLAADACATRGLKVSETSDAPNPLVLGIGTGPAQYATSVRELLADTGIDALMVSYVERHDGDPEGVLDAICEASERQLKPVVASVVRSDGQLAARTGSRVPNFLFPESCAAVLARAADRRAWLSRPLGEQPHYPDLDGTAARALISACLDHEPAGDWLSLADAEALLATHGIPVLAAHRCRELERAVEVAREIGGPVALVANLAAPAHASDIDAMLVRLEDEEAIRSGWRELERRVRATGSRWTGALVQSSVPHGADVLVGAFSDPDLGPVIAVGPGGRLAGLGESVAFRLPPATDFEADELIDSCQTVATQLDGFRGAAALDRAALHELILRFAQLLAEVPEVVEADLNPVRCTTNGCVVLDMRVRIEPRRPVERVKTW